MPELPEVETVVRSLRPHLVGRKILHVETGPKRLRTAWQADWAVQLRGSIVAEIRRRGKWILIPLAGRDDVLVIHLGMTGRLTVQKADAPRTTHTHMVFSLDQGQQLRFHDPRRFGSVTLLRDGLAAFEAASRLGPEPFDADARQFHEALRRSKRCLKALLLDQTVLAGLGNIYADEALYEAKLHPRRPGASVSKYESDRLRKAAVKVLRRAIDAKGSTIANFSFGEGEQGGYQSRFLVYGRTAQPCRRCRRPIRRLRLAGRSTHFCPTCQPLRVKKGPPSAARPKEPRRESAG